MNIDEQAIENVKSFIYLESELTWDNECSKDVQRLSSHSSVQLVTIYMEDSRIMTDVKLQLLMTIVFPVLLYAAETWTVNK